MTGLLPGPWSASFDEPSFYGGRMTHISDSDGVFRGRMKTLPGDNYAGGGWAIRNASGAVVVSGVWTTENRDSLEEVVRLIAASPKLLASVESDYVELANVHNEWPGRNTVAGQQKLCRMRDLIAEATGRDEQDVQDDYGNRNAIAKAARNE